MIIDCIADLHGHYPELEGGDLLIVAGDLTRSDQFGEHEDFRHWLADQDYRCKVFIAGNHDNYLTESFPYPPEINFVTGNYLCDSGTEFEGLKIWGSPWTKRFEGMNPRCMAFTCETEDELKAKFSMIPEDTDILITHSPPYGILDKVNRRVGDPVSVGSFALASRVQKVRPLLHVFGHIHESYGAEKWSMGELKVTDYINCSHVNEYYEPVNKPIRIELPRR